ncbi:MAG: hypothetical protein OXH09_00650 [Gammaproteobacteria bacterium]|nr:hypothetical protein [Gammaproteobacteria bacterium]
MAGQRALLRRVAATRFGEAVGERVETLLGDTEDWERLSATAERITTAKSEAEIIESVSEVVRLSDQPDSAVHTVGTRMARDPGIWASGAK